MLLRPFLTGLVLLFFCIGHSQEFTLEVDPALKQLITVGDSDGDKKITVEDSIRGNFKIQADNGEIFELESVYFLSNLLQELALADMQEKDSLTISLDQIKEPPSERISRRISDQFWDDLTRTIDRKGLRKILKDTKASDQIPRLYVPAEDSTGIDYFLELEMDFPDLEVVILPRQITPEFVKSINDRPGLLALKIENDKGVPFVVPGGRFNEMYGWDSYFHGIGLILDGRVDLAKAMVDNFIYQIKYYGKILNANRSYYLTRTQPPFLSSFIREVYRAMEQKDPEWLQEALDAAITEYEEVWMEEGVRLTGNGLNRYYGEGIGIPPETEEGHFSHILNEYAEKYQVSVAEFRRQYSSGEIDDASLDTYFVHDRSVRESGHDTSWRLEGRAADLNTVDLNSLLYKYEKDFEYLISRFFNGTFTDSEGNTYSSSYWQEMAENRKGLMNRYLWNQKKGSYFDYNFKEEEQTGYISATNYYPLWTGMVSDQKAERMVRSLIKNLKATGGILSSARSSVEKSATNEVQRQWDYPFGWAPHQMLMWRGLLHYGYREEATEMIYRWLWTITTNAVNYNGTVPEKFDVVHATHKVYAEYGNVGTEFDYITTSGFGWMNASYQLGLSLLPETYVEKLNELVHPDALF